MAQLTLSLDVPVVAHALPAAGTRRSMRCPVNARWLRFSSASNFKLERGSFASQTFTDGDAVGASYETYAGGTVHTVQVPGVRGRSRNLHGAEIGITATGAAQTVDVTALALEG